MSENTLPPAIFLMGPTASGKTALAIDLVAHLPCDIISVDSALVYRGMDIGTAKPSAAELARAPHRLIDICDPREAYSAARFCEDALDEMEKITACGRIPLLVGGTMLYFRALEQGLSDLPEADRPLRIRLEQEAALMGWEHMHRRLQRLDPVSAERIHPNDPQRISRALEVCELSGRPMSELLGRQQGHILPYRTIKLARAPRERSVLHERIAERFQQMLEQGFEQEVRELLESQRLVPDMPSMRSVGYRQMVKYLLGEWDRATMIEKGIVATRQLAKRQLTWLRADPAIHWLYDEEGDILPRALKFIAEALK